MKTGPKPISPEVRFFRHIITEPSTGCWLWTGQMMKSGYGQFGIAAHVSDGAHRYSWRIHRGDIPQGMFVRHHCNVKLCVNPNHLYLATPKKNSMDAAKDGLLGRKLDAEKVLQIHALLKEGASLADLGRKYGVVPELIGAIRHSRNWIHVIPC